MKYTHYLITRFNIVQEWFFHSTAENRRTAILTSEWLQQRFMLFEEYCLPSVMQQRNADFKWLVLFNSETPDEYKEKIEAYERLFPAFTPLYLQPYADEATFVRSYIRLHTTTPYIITTRMDNDDMLHQDYLSTIQQAFSEQQDVFINYKTGLQYDLIEQVMYRWDYDANHYFSRIESLTDDVKTVIGIAHDKIQYLNYYELSAANTPPLWIEIVHSHNVANHIDGRLHPVRVSTEPFGVILPQPWTAYKKVLLQYYRYKLLRVWQRLTNPYHWIRRKVEKHILHKL